MYFTKLVDTLPIGTDMCGNVPTLSERSHMHDILQIIFGTPRQQANVHHQHIAAHCWIEASPIARHVIGF